MNEYLHHLKCQIPALICPSLFADQDLDAALTARDSPGFETNWIHAYESLSGSEAKIDENTAALILDVEKTAFLQVYAATGASDFTELAPVISEDFGLFARALVHDAPNPWLSGLFSSYRKGILPHGDVEPVAVPLRTLINEA